jgi:hypothetical protein
MTMSRDQASNVGQDTRLLRDDELEVVSGGFIVDGCRQALGGPDTSPLSRYVGNPNETGS